MQYSVLFSVLYASMALAVTVTSPDNTTTWNDSGSNTIKWTSVNTDPSTANIVLINNAVFPNTEMTIASNVQTSLGSYTVNSLTGNGVGYQVNLMSTTNNQILGQSGQFTLSNSSPASGGGSSSSASMSLSTSTFAASSSSTSLASSSLASMSTSGMSTMSTASTASTASTGSTMSTATASGTTTGSAGIKATSVTASSTAASSTSSSGATMNTIGFAGLGFGSLFALLS